MAVCMGDRLSLYPSGCSKPGGHSYDIGDVGEADKSPQNVFHHYERLMLRLPHGPTIKTDMSSPVMKGWSIADRRRQGATTTTTTSSRRRRRKRQQSQKYPGGARRRSRASKPMTGSAPGTRRNMISRQEMTRSFPPSLDSEA